MKVRILGFVLTLVFSCTCLLTKGQPGNLIELNRNLPDVYQRNRYLCWAASMEMIFGYWNPSGSYPSQCDVQDLYLPFVGKSPGCPKNSLIILSSDTKIKVDYFDQLFSRFGFHSTQRVSGLTTVLSDEYIKTEIEQCRPLILGLIKDSGHLVVVYGFRDFVGTTNDEIYVKDPLADTAAVSQEAMYMFDALLNRIPFVYEWLDDTGRTVKSETIIGMRNYVYNIYPDSLKLNFGHCDSCGNTDISAIKVSSNNHYILPDIIDELRSSNRIPGYPESTISSGDLVRFFRSEEYLSYPVIELNGEQIKRLNKRSLEGKDIQYLKMYEIVGKELPQQLTSTFIQTGNGELKLLKIAPRQNIIPKDIKIKTPRGTVVLSNQGEAVPFTLIRIPEMGYEFFRFEYENKTYFSPLVDQSGFFNLKQGEGIPEDIIISRLKNIVKIQDEQIRQQLKEEWKLNKKRFK